MLPPFTLIGINSGTAAPQFLVKDQRALILFGRPLSALGVKRQTTFLVHGRNVNDLSVRTAKSYYIIDMASDIAHVVTGSRAIISSGTSINVPIPSAVIDDTLIMHVMHRSALTTPSGWTLEGTSGATVQATQRISVLSRVADGSEGATINVVQAASGRMIGNVSVFRGTVGSITTTTGATTTNGDPITTGAVSVTEGIAIIASTYVLAGSGSVITYPSNYTALTDPDLSDNRLFAAYREAPYGYSSAGEDMSNGGASQGNWAVTILEIP